jgi:hypothetical protein
MNSGIWLLWLLLFGFGLASCTPSSTAPTPVSPAASPVVSAPSVTPTSSPSPPRRPEAVAPAVQDPNLSPSLPEPTGTANKIQQDYAPLTPLPSTGQVTQRGQIRNLEPERLLTSCPADSGPYAFAESTNYQIQICSQEYDPWLPKYYIGRAKDGSGELRITSSNPTEARQLIFKNEGYTYVLYRDGVHPDRSNAYLQVYTPDGSSYAEALFYLYEATNPPQSFYFQVYPGEFG